MTFSDPRFCRDLDSGSSPDELFEPLLSSPSSPNSPPFVLCFNRDDWLRRRIYRSRISLATKGTNGYLRILRSGQFFITGSCPTNFSSYRSASAAASQPPFPTGANRLNSFIISRRTSHSVYANGFNLTDTKSSALTSRAVLLRELMPERPMSGTRRWQEIAAARYMELGRTHIGEMGLFKPTSPTPLSNLMGFGLDKATLLLINGF